MYSSHYTILVNYSENILLQRRREMIDTKNSSTVYKVIHKLIIQQVLGKNIEDRSVVTPMALHTMSILLETFILMYIFRVIEVVLTMFFLRRLDPEFVMR